MDISGYVQQDELFVSTLTVKEHLNIQANLRLVNMNSKERQQRVNEVKFVTNFHLKIPF
jgi:ABC-type multidrug transport system ATPase subunit